MSKLFFGDFTSLIFELTLINFGFWSTSSAWAQPFPAGARSPAGPNLAPPLLWGLVTTYDVHLRLTGKRVVDSY